ncbi:MAG: carbohydrate ABC transporter permease [Clostridiales bacterium]|nr:carbohydrate ABC transporter permease [Clostridiales bacterium]
MFKTSKKRLNRKIGGDIAIFIFLALVGAFMLLPFVYSIVQSIKPMSEIFIFPPRFFVRDPTLENFSSLFQMVNTAWVPFLRYLFNSLFVSLVATAAHVILASMAAFPLAKFKFPGSNLLFQIIVVSLLFTTEVTALPLYIVMAELHLIDTYMALIFPAIGASLGLFLMKQFMTSIPDSMIEAARVDGAKTFYIFWKIVMPNVKPAWLTCVIFAFQSIWNNDGSQFIYDEAYKTLPTLFRQISEGGIARAGVSAAAAVLLMIPPIVIFVASQGQVMETMAHSGMKD